MHQSGARGRSGSGGPWRRFVIALCSMQRISDRRPSAVPKSKYPRNALCTPDVESPLVRSTLSMPPLIWRHDRPLRSMIRVAGKRPIGDAPDATTRAMSRRLPCRRVAGHKRRGTAPQFPDTPRAPGRIRAARGPYQRVDRRGSPTLAAIDLSSVRNTTKIRPTRPSLLGWLGVANTRSLEPAPPPRAVRCGAAAAVARVAPIYGSCPLCQRPARRSPSRNQ